MGNVPSIIKELFITPIKINTEIAAAKITIEEWDPSEEI